MRMKTNNGTEVTYECDIYSFSRTYSENDISRKTGLK